MGGKFTKFFKCTVDRAGWEATSRELECLSQTTWRDDKNLNSLSKIQSRVTSPNGGFTYDIGHFLYFRSGKTSRSIGPRIDNWM